jgi:hypothetical protein
MEIGSFHSAVQYTAVQYAVTGSAVQCSCSNDIAVAVQLPSSNFMSPKLADELVCISNAGSLLLKD